jgi:hypothetical protein
MADRLKLRIQTLTQRVMELEAELEAAKAEALEASKPRPVSKPKAVDAVVMTTARKRKR